MKFLKFYDVDGDIHVLNIPKVEAIFKNDDAYRIDTNMCEVNISENTFYLILEKIEDLGHEIIQINSVEDEDLSREYQGNIADAILREDAIRRSESARSTLTRMIPTTGVENREFEVSEDHPTTDFTADDIPF